MQVYLELIHLIKLELYLILFNRNTPIEKLAILIFCPKSFHVKTKTIFVILSITFLCQVLNFLGCPILHFMMAISDYLVKG